MINYWNAILGMMLDNTNLVDLDNTFNISINILPVKNNSEFSSITIDYINVHDFSANKTNRLRSSGHFSINMC